MELRKIILGEETHIQKDKCHLFSVSEACGTKSSDLSHILQYQHKPGMLKGTLLGWEGMWESDGEGDSRHQMICV